MEPACPKPDPTRVPRRSIASGRGDAGETDLLTGQRVSKTHPQIEALGACDELSAALGLARANCPEPETNTLIADIQRDLIAIMGEVACDEGGATAFLERARHAFSPDRVHWIESVLHFKENDLPQLHGWVVAGDNAASAALDFARATARRAERRVVALTESGRDVRPIVHTYLNRLSDLLWLLARHAAKPDPA